MHCLVSRLLFTAFVAALLALSPASAHDYEQGGILVVHPWTKESVGKNAAVYMSLENKGDEVDRLIGVETELAEEAELHTHLVENNVVRMRRVEAFEVHPGTPTVLKQGSHHIMLIRLKKPLREGELAPLTLVFERAGKIKVEAYIEAWAESDGAPEKHHKHNHGS